MKPAFIVNDKIKLVYPNPSFSKPLFELIESNKSYLNQHITFAQNKDSLASVGSFLKEIESFNIGGQKFNLLIEYENTLAGIIGFHRIDRINAKAEIGYWIGQSYQGNGILAQVMPVFLSYGFNTLAINRVDLLTLISHQRSIRLAERSGFIKEGVLKEYYFMHDAFQDAVLYRMLRSDFNF